MKTVFISIFASFLWFAQAAANDIVSPFAGSEPLGEYQTEFTRFYFLSQSDDRVETQMLEGALKSRLFRKPEGKSNFEIFKSYERELRAEGFEMLVVLEDVKQAELLARAVNKNGNNSLGKRPYKLNGKIVGALEKARVASQGQEYLSAKKTIGDKDVLLVINTSSQGDYVIEQFETAAMEEGTVALTLDALTQKISNEGRIAIYGIHFDTGSDVIKSESAETVATIVEYLSANPDKTFYVVGHTDDQGALNANMSLSNARAAAVVDAVIAKLPAAKGKLIARGVGPLSPVATNGEDDGRRLNRRVELVSSIN